MEEIQVGEFVRTKNGLIRKVKTIYSGKRKFCLTTQTRINASIRLENITKHSFNLIDLIEVNDYVNGKLIHHTDIRKNSAYIYYGNGKTFVDYQIKSIVTHEQFTSLEYKVEEK